MQYTDILFLFVFLPSLLAAYYICSQKYRNIILIIFSLIFYSCGAPEYMGLLYMMLFVDTFLGCLMVKIKTETQKEIINKQLLIIGVIFNLGILVYYKYFNFIVVNTNKFFDTGFTARDILLPLGLSFYSFRAISYLIDCYSGKVSEANPITVAAYLSFFGQIQSGPIARYETFNISHNQLMPSFSDGVVRFMIGFSKKVLIADTLNNITVEIFDKTAALSFSLAWLGSICYSLQLYYDFSGYSDMAIGVCKMLGYNCPENFDHPYMTKSVSEFWRRWHITLGAWFRDYVYIPLGGSRVKKSRLVFNLFIVWLFTGIWHGAGWNFIVWGIGHFILISLEKSLKLPQKIKNSTVKALYRMGVLLAVNFQWVIFRCVNLNKAREFIVNMCTIRFGGVDIRASFLLIDYAPFIIMALIFIFPVRVKLETLSKNNKKVNAFYQVLHFVIVMGLFLAALSFVIGGHNNPFLYMGF